MTSATRRAAVSLTAWLTFVSAPLAFAQDVSFIAEDVRFPSDPGTILAGTLERPGGSEAGPIPVALLIAGTGPWTRGGWIAIRARLHRAGIATLMYDKRGQGQSTGTFVDTIPVMEQDVTAAVAFIRTRSDIDSRRIALVGLSQGAVTAPLVASKDPAIAAVVMLSGPVGPRGELFLNILRGHLRNAGKSEQQVGRVTADVSAWMEARSQRAVATEIARTRQAALASFRSVGSLQRQAESFVTTLDNDVVLSMFEVAPDRALAGLRAPVLAIYGLKDDIIAPTASIRAASTALANHPDAMVVAIPGMTHVLTRATPLPRAAVGEEGTLPAVTELIGTWLERQLTRPVP